MKYFMGALIFASAIAAFLGMGMIASGLARYRNKSDYDL